MSSRFAYKIHFDTMIATADISKRKLSCYFRMANGGPECKVFECVNSIEGLKEYHNRMQEFARCNHAEQILVGYESTGVFHIPFMQFFKDMSHRLLQVNTMHVKRMKDITDNTPAKTDNKDPKVIADIIEMRHALQLVIPTGAMAEMRQLIHARERVLEHLTAVSNQLQDVVYTLFPEFSSVIKDITSHTARRLLREYPTPSAINSLGLDRLTAIMHKVSRGKLGRDKADDLCRAAQQSLGASEGREGLQMEIGLLLDIVDEFKEQRTRYEDALESLVQQMPEGRFLLSIKGIGPLTIAGIMGEYDGFNPFETIGEVLKYGGMNFTENSSGRRQGKRRMTKRGRGLVRKLVYYAAMNTVKKGRAFYGVYQKHLEKGMEKPKALMAVGRKIIRTLFALKKNCCVFDISHVTQYRLAA